MGICWDSSWEYRENVGIGLGFLKGRWPADGVVYESAAKPWLAVQARGGGAGRARRSQVGVGTVRIQPS